METRCISRRSPGAGPVSAGQRGVTLIEALIAILLISISALAFASLQLKGLSANASSLWRSKAVQLAQDMADRMRANRAGVSAGAYQSFLAPGSTPGCGSSASTACSPRQTAAFDYADWSASVAQQLPSGQGAVCIDSTPDDGVAGSPACDGAGSSYVIKVFWSEHGVPFRLALGVRP